MNDEAFSAGWDAAFRLSPFRLRFELGGEIFGSASPIPRFVQAFGRARQVAFEIFQHSREVVGLVATWPDTAQDLFAPAPDGFEALNEAGFQSPCVSEWNASPFPGDQEDVPLGLWRAFDLSENMPSRDVLLWCAVSYEMAITPKAPVLSYLIDRDRGILLHVYDDRGMDVTGLTRESLHTTYRDRTDWLLDFDRARMSAAFEPGS
jgi:hypothetical protein